MDLVDEHLDSDSVVISRVVNIEEKIRNKFRKAKRDGDIILVDC